MPRRRPAAAELRAIAAGGIEALRLAERLAGAGAQVQIRVSAARKALWQAAAKRAGKSLSAWLSGLADGALE